MKKILFNIINQIIPIMIGVYLGFALNNYGENRKLKKEAATFKTMLKNEIQENLQQIKGVVPYHDTLSNIVNEMLSSKDIEAEFSKFKFQGLRPGMVNSSAYKTGIQTGILQEFDMKLIQRLNRLYAYQDNYEEYNRTMLSTFLSKDFPDSESEIKSLFTVISMNMIDVRNFEKQLIHSYGKVLERLK